MRLLLIRCATAASLSGAPAFTLSSSLIETYDFVEVTVKVPPASGNPFLTGELSGAFVLENQAPLPVNGFCDASDGSVYRIRFLPRKPGKYQFQVQFHSLGDRADWSGSFTAEPSHRRGLVRVDPAHPWHFLWEGTGEHYFWNGLTTYALMGWQDEGKIQAIIDRAARLKVNRLRVVLNGPRVTDASRWYEPVAPSSAFRFLFGPWMGAHPENVHDPGWDTARFDVAFWQKYERMLRYARERDVAISVIFFLDGEDAGADPFGKANRFGENEKRYYLYAAARLSAYSNVMWDITNEWHLFRDAWWVERMGTYLKSLDPYKHLASCHGRDQFPWMISEWPDFAMFQLWDEGGGYEAMRTRRELQAKSGRAMPQVNEEYGYEDHYPVKWGENRRPPARSADNRRRLAWEITMAGCYQTSGERANRGDGNSPATPGGWTNGGFDSSMTMLEGYRNLVDFFTAIEYWKLEPVLDSKTTNVRVLAEQGRQYVLYFPHGGAGHLPIAKGDYVSRWYNPRSAKWSAGVPVKIDLENQDWETPAAPDSEDWVLLLQRS